MSLYILNDIKRPYIELTGVEYEKDYVGSRNVDVIWRYRRSSDKPRKRPGLDYR